MRRLLSLLAAAGLAVLVLLAASADAKVNVRVGIGDQHTAMFDQPAFQRLKFKQVRYFIVWNAIDDPKQLAAARAYVVRARQDNFSVLLHVSTDDLRSKKAKLPSVAQYRSKVGRLVRYFRGLGVTEFGTWNEVNHPSQPTYRSPTRAAQFFREMYRMVKGSCSSCSIVALDVLDQAGVEKYIDSWYRALSPYYRRRATVVGIHNYGDVNRQRTTFTRNIIAHARRFNRSTKFWFTETGGLVVFGRKFPCSTQRAAARLKDVFKLAKTYQRSGVQRVYIYNWTGLGCDAHFDAGLVDAQGIPRLGYTILRQQLANYLT